MQERVDVAGGLAAWGGVAPHAKHARKPDDFVPVWDEQPKRAQTPEEMIAFMRGLKFDEEK